MGGLKEKKQSRIYTHRSQSSKNPAALNSSSIMSSKSNPSCCTRETIIPISPMNLNKVYAAFTLLSFKIVAGGFHEFTKISRGRLAFHMKTDSSIQARERANCASLHCRVRWLNFWHRAGRSGGGGWGVGDSHLFQEDSSLLQRKQREKKLNVKKTSALVIKDYLSNKWDKP